MSNSAEEITCIGVNGLVYRMKRFCALECNSRGLPIGYEALSLPSVEMVDRAFSQEQIDEHPLVKARFKFIAAKEHNIVEKQRPTDTTLAEVVQGVETFFRERGFEKPAVDFILKEYWS